MERDLWIRRGACLAAVTVALLGSALLRTAGAHALGFSFTPSKTEPYAVCGRPAPRHAECLAILVPTASARSVSGSLGQAGPALVDQPYSGSGVGGGFAPADLRSAYNLPLESTEFGQTVAIVDAYDDPNAESDLATYRARYGISPCTAANHCFKKVNQSGGTSSPSPDAGWAVEISLDLDMASAACPNCKILLVEASSSADSNLFAAEDEAVALGATEVSNSWAGEELSGETSDDSFFRHPGVPITAAAGDSGYGVEYPAASQYVIAVGGTRLTHASNSRGWSETAWSGTGSGCSAYEPKPAWQTDKGCANRTDTDVAAVASPETPVSVSDSYQLPAEFSQPEAGWTLVAGTSVSSPLVAGTMALANAHTKSFGGADALYREAAHNGTGVLDDVLSGSNGNCGTYLCNAGPGYDGPTGLGSLYGVPAAPPEWYTNGQKAGEGVKAATISWGTLALQSGAGTVTCRTVSGGYVENPTGGGAGRGATESFNPYECVGSGCAAALDVKAEKLPWSMELTEPENGVIREKSTDVGVRVKCFIPATANEAEKVLSNALFTGESTPSTQDGPSATKPSFNEFGAGSGELSSELGPGRISGSVKVLGYEEQEVITAD